VSNDHSKAVMNAMPVFTDKPMLAFKPYPTVPAISPPFSRAIIPVQPSVHPRFTPDLCGSPMSVGRADVAVTRKRAIKNPKRVVRRLFMKAEMTLLFRRERCGRYVPVVR